MLENNIYQKTHLCRNSVLSNISVGKQSPCLLSFVYASYIRYGVRAAPKFGKYASLFSFHKEQEYIKAIICSVISLFFRKKCLHLEHFETLLVPKCSKQKEKFKFDQIVNVCHI